MPVVSINPGVNHNTIGCAYQDSHCDISLEYGLLTLNALPLSTQPSVIRGKAIKINISFQAE